MRLPRALRLLLPLLASAMVAAGPLRLVSPDYWCPFSCPASQPQQGFTIDILRAALETQGYDISFRNMNYARALVAVRQGQFDAIPAVYRNEAPDFVFSRQAIARNRYCVYTAPESRWSYRQPADLAGKRIGLIKGYDYGARLNAWLDRTESTVDLHTGDQIVPRMMSKVAMKRLDALVEDESVVDWLLHQRNGPPLRKAGCEAASWSYLAISPRYPQADKLAHDFDSGLRLLRSNGQLANIMANYGLKGW